MGNNPYDDPYVPGFVNQRPRLQAAPQPVQGYKPNVYGQIQSVNGFDGARDFALNRLTPGSSTIIAEADPNLARVYIVAKDQNSLVLATGYDLTPVEEPKPITMQDISNQLADIQGRLNKLEGNAVNDKPVQYVNPDAKSTKNVTTDGGKQPKLPSGDGVH